MKYLLDKMIITEVEFLANFFQVDSNLLYYIAYYALSQRKSESSQALIGLQSLKKAIFLYFNVQNTSELKRSKSFQKATRHFSDLNLKRRRDWEELYREFIGDLPVDSAAIACHSNDSSTLSSQQALEDNQIVIVYDMNLAFQRASKSLFN